MVSSDPREWSDGVIGGKMDGESGPGVGTAESDVQGDESLGMLVTVGRVVGISSTGVDGATQDESIRMMLEASMMFLNFCMIFRGGSLPKVDRRKSSTIWC